MNNLRNHLVFILLCGLFELCCLPAAYAKYNLLFTTEQNVPNSLINVVAESPDEMIWVATEDGLCRFDGSAFVSYIHDKSNPNSLCSNIVRTVFVDMRGHVLVATNNGLQCYRPETDDFSNPIFDETNGIPLGNVGDMTSLPNGDVLVAGNTSFTVHFDEDDIPHAIPNGFTESLPMSYQCCVDRFGRMWYINFNDGLFTLDEQGKVSRVTPINHTEGYNVLRSGPDGAIYLAGLTRGLFRYHPNTNAIETLTGPDDNWQVRDMCAIPGTQRMYICTDGDGVKLLDCVTGQITQATFDDVSVDAATQKVHSLIVSKRGDIWMALYQKGVFVVAHDPLEFHYYGPKSLRHNCVGERCITSLFRASDGNLWVATDNGGLYGVDRSGKTIAHFDCSSYGGKLPSSMLKLYQDKKGRMWFGSYRQAGGIVDLKTGDTKYIPIDGQEELTFNVYDYAEDKRGTLWVATMGQGILRYDEQKQHFIPEETLFSCNWTAALYYDPMRDKLLCGTYDGVIEVDLTKRPLACRQALPQYVVYAITKCTETQYCLCTNLGMVIMDCNTGEYTIYTREEGLPNNNTYAALSDGEGNLWISGSTGLSRFNLTQKTFQNYTLQDGLQSCEFYKNTCWRDEDGTLWFGGTEGITFFDPHKIQREKEIPVPRVVRMKAGQYFIQRDKKGVFNIASDDHAFSLDLATCPILQTRTANYRYALDDDHWQTLPPTANRVTFSHIGAGTHKFRFQVIDEQGASPEEFVLIHIEYPWYAQWWAWILWTLIFCLVTAASVYYVRRLRHERLKVRAKERETAINEAKLQFFMNIAHDFRTPMTLVVSPLQKLMSTDKDPQRQYSYQLMNRNANRVLVLINELMDLRKIDKEQMRLQCRLSAPGKLLGEMCESVSDLIENRKLSLTIDDCFPAERHTWIDHECFEKIIINLLSNAIKYTPQGGKICIACELQNLGNDPQREVLSISVTDTGVGIAMQDRQHIFERFYQVRHATHSMGTGIGLNLVAALVKLHHGEISVDDNPLGQGTRFTVQLPVGDSFYPESERMVDTEEVAPALKGEISSSELLRGTMTQEEIPLDSNSAKNRRRILVVDDDDEVRNYLVQELRAKYRVSSCVNGQEAMQLLQSDEHFDIIISDVMMPVMDGEELCRRIRSNVLLNYLPIILLTAKASEEDRLHSLDLGANAFIAKPFNVELILRTVANLIGSQDRLRSTYSGSQLPLDRVETPEISSPDERLLERILKVINANLSNPDLTSEDIAREVGLSRVHLYRKLKELTNQSARNYIRNIRLAKAAEILSQKKMSVSEVAYQVGFANPNNFATAFKELYGISPTGYMERNNAMNITQHNKQSEKE